MSAKQGKSYSYVLLVVAFFTVLEVSNSSSCKCGRPNVPRIVGGGEVDPSQYPWLVILEASDNPNVITKCVGALIHPRWILTAAHCVYRTSGNCKPTNTIREKCITPATKVQITPGSMQGTQRQLEVSQVILNENYRPISNDHDIALLELQSAVKCDEKISPICLSKGREMESPGTPVIAAGWGKTGEEETAPDVLKHASMIVSQCPNNDSETLCAIGDSSNDSRGTPCDGDSGSPLMYNDKSVYYTIGVTSGGGEGCRIDDPTTFVKVSKYREWINHYVNLKVSK